MSQAILTSGQQVFARDPRTLKWRPAMLGENKPYSCRGRRISDGWYVYWLDIPAPSPSDPHYSASSGGWLAVNCIRPTDPTTANFPISGGTAV